MALLVPNQNEAEETASNKIALTSNIIKIGKQGSSSLVNKNFKY